MQATLKLASAVLALVIPVANATAQQAPYPNRPITWVLPFGAGGVTDNSARFVAKVLSEKIGQPVIVENKPGAAGIVGAEIRRAGQAGRLHDALRLPGPMSTFPFLYKKLSL